MPAEPKPLETPLPEGPEYHYVTARWLAPRHGKVTRLMKAALGLSALAGFGGAYLFVQFLATKDANPPTWMFALALGGFGCFSCAGYAALWQLDHNVDRP